MNQSNNDNHTIIKKIFHVFQNSSIDDHSAEIYFHEIKKLNDETINVYDAVSSFNCSPLQYPTVLIKLRSKEINDN